VDGMRNCSTQYRRFAKTGGGLLSRLGLEIRFLNEAGDLVSRSLGLGCGGLVCRRFYGADEGP